MAEEESASDPQFLGLLHLGWDVFAFVVKPIGIAIGNTLYYLAFGLLLVLRLLWRPLEFLLLPVLYLGDFILRCALAPFRFLAKFETLYIFLGIAALIGIAGGIIISLLSGTLQSLLGLDAKDPPQHARTVKEWRKGKPKDRMSETSSTSAGEQRSQSSSTKKSGKRKGKIGKVGKPPTILEELDSDY